MARRTATDPPATIEQRAGYGVGLGVLGVIALAALLLINDNPIAELVFCLIFTPIFGVIMWATSRSGAERRRTVLDRITGTDPRQGFIRGLGQATVVAVGIGLFIVLFVWVFGPDQSWSVVPAVLLGSAMWMALEARDRRRWEGSDAKESGQG